MQENWFRLNRPLENNTYYWSVRARDGARIFGEWTPEASFTIGVPTPTITFDGSQLISDANGCLLDTSNIIDVVLTEIGKISNQGFRIFPNPTKGIINFSGIQDAKIEIFNSIGGHIKSKVLVNEQSIE
ncbi:MAG: hypothetical protein ACI8X3_003022 [Saprospiraceae bacterium]